MKQTAINYLFYAISAMFVAVYFFIVYTFTVNVPMDDDFLGLQKFLVQFIEANHSGEKISLLLEGFGMGYIHRILFVRLIALIVYIITGGLNYNVYVFIVALILLGLGILIYNMIHDKNIKGLQTLLIVLLLFNGQIFINFAVPLYGLVNIGISLLAFLSIFLMLLNNRCFFTGGLILSLLTIYSNGNGMLIIPPVLACLCIQKRVKALIIFGSFSIIAALFYFYNLDVTRISGSIWNNFHEKIMYFFYFVGGNVWLPSQKLISFFVGLCFFIVYIWGILYKKYEKNLFCYACLTFLYLSAVPVAFGNSYGTVPIYYRIYSSLFLILTLIVIMDNAKAFRLHKMKYLFLALALLFNVASMIIYNMEMQKNIESKKVSTYNWINEETGVMTYRPVEAAFYLKEAERLGIYRMPQYPLFEYKSAICSDKNHKKSYGEEISYKIEYIKQEEPFLIIKGWSYFKSKPMEHTDIYIYLVNKKNSTQLIYYPCFERRCDIVKDVTKVRCGFFAVIDKTEIPSGTYTIEIGIKSRLSIKGNVSYVTTDQTLEI
jgi:hypothetical protein